MAPSHHHLAPPGASQRLTPDDLERLTASPCRSERQAEILVLMLRGTGKYFCSGYDIGSIGGGRRIDFAAVVDAVEEARPGCIAVLHGSVYGGATDLALACDFRLGAGESTCSCRPHAWACTTTAAAWSAMSPDSVWTTPSVCS
jgi:enoyl-CoA hydratase/carnithine racemase